MNFPDKPLDVIIIGGGPAGMSAAVWCKDLGLEALLIEKNPALGGQLHHTYNPIENYLGLGAENGADMLAHFTRTLERSGFEGVHRAEVVAVNHHTKTLSLLDGSERSWKALIIATGVRRRNLCVAGENEFRGRGIIESGARDKKLVQGKRVLIVGGGDAAIENALMLSEVAASVTVAIRGSTLRARDQFLEPLVSNDRVKLLKETSVSEIVGGECVSGVRLRSSLTGEEWTEEIDAVLIRIGVEPNSELLRDIVDVDDRYYVKVNPLGETSVADIFAIGDVANPIAPTIAAAAGTGSVAANTIYYSLQKQKDIIRATKGE